MPFKKLLADFIAGVPIKRKPWGGYWVYRYGKIDIYTKKGKIVAFLDTEDIIFTLSGILQNDWEKATPENCPILAKQ